MIIVEICERFGWDYHTYMAQPEWFIKLIIERAKIDAQKNKQLNQTHGNRQ